MKWSVVQMNRSCEDGCTLNICVHLNELVYYAFQKSTHLNTEHMVYNSTHLNAEHIVYNTTCIVFKWLLNDLQTEIAFSPSNESVLIQNTSIFLALLTCQSAKLIT